jgi:V/A-type H+-transporting ATPase subunit I
MQRVALLAPSESLRDLLVHVADEGTVEIEEIMSDEGTQPGTPAATRLQRLQSDSQAAVLARTPPDLDGCEASGRVDLIAGEAQLEHHREQALTRASVSALTGWMPATAMPALAERVRGFGGAVVPMPRPAGSEPPTLLTQHGAAREFAPLVETYGTVPYADINPSLLAGLAYIFMFGMMFADAGQGLLLVILSLVIRRGHWHRLDRLRKVWLFLLGAGVTSTAFGLLYGEFFGPTGVVPVVWLEPLEHPVTLLFSAVGIGAVLLAGAYGLGTVNRFREGGWRRAVYAPSGLAGVALFLGIGCIAAAAFAHIPVLGLLGTLVAASGLVIAYAGLFAAAGGGGAGVGQAAVELFDMIIRLGSNLVSFARLAAFGLTHAALGSVVWDATSGAAHRGILGLAGAVAIFLVGNALSFALEGLVAGIQALRLEYYELFSRIFDSEGRPFEPWHVPLEPLEEPC